jgi:hypothetical protein
VEEAMDIALGIAVVFATLAGPLLAVFVTRHNDRVRQRVERQMEVFRSLMSSRRTVLSAERVKALNMIEIEFHGIQAVQHAYRELMGHAAMARPLPANWEDEHRKRFTRLLSEMGKVLGYDLPQLDVLEGGYYPQGLMDIESEQQAVRRALIEVLTGRRPLAVGPVAPTPPSPFPPPPTPLPLPGAASKE